MTVITSKKWYITIGIFEFMFVIDIGAFHIKIFVQCSIKNVDDATQPAIIIIYVTVTLEKTKEKTSRRLGEGVNHLSTI